MKIRLEIGELALYGLEQQQANIGSAIEQELTRLLSEDKFSAQMLNRDIVKSTNSISLKTQFNSNSKVLSTKIAQAIYMGISEK
jgi:hypothetical protein